MRRLPTLLTIACFALPLGACDYLHLLQPPYGATVVVGESVADFARAVGPVAVIGAFSTDQSDTGGPRLSADRSVAEICEDDGELWVRNNDIWFEPYVPTVAVLPNEGTVMSGTEGPWRRWDGLADSDRTSEIEVRFGQNAPCRVDYEISITVVPLSKDFVREDQTWDDEFRCKQPDSLSFSRASIAIGPGTSYSGDCDPSPRPVLNTEDGLADNIEGYPPGAPRPDWLEESAP